MVTRRSVGVVGLNPGTAIYAQYLAKEGYSVTLFTQVGEYGLRLLDYEVHVRLGLMEPNSARLFTMKYLVDVLGMEVRSVSMGDVEVSGNEVRIGDGRFTFDKVLVGTESRVSGECVPYVLVDPTDLGNSRVKFRGKDLGKALELAMIITELGGSVEVPRDLPLDADVLRNLELRSDGDGELCISVDYDVFAPKSNHGYIVGKGVVRVDPLSGLKFTVWRDQLLLIMGKMAAMRELGLMDNVPNIVPLEVGFSRNWSYAAIGLPRTRLIEAYRDLSSSRITFRSRKAFVSSKLNYRGRRILSLQWLGYNQSMNWVYMAYGLIMGGLSNYLILDSGYEASFSVVRGIWESLVLDTL